MKHHQPKRDSGDSFGLGLILGSGLGLFIYHLTNTKSGKKLLSDAKQDFIKHRQDIEQALSHRDPLSSPGPIRLKLISDHPWMRSLLLTNTPTADTNPPATAPKTISPKERSPKPKLKQYFTRSGKKLST